MPETVWSNLTAHGYDDALRHASDGDDADDEARPPAEDRQEPAPAPPPTPTTADLLLPDTAATGEDSEVNKQPRLI